LRTLYRFIDEGQLPAYKMGRVIRLQAGDVDAFIARARIAPGTLEHLYPDPRGAQPGRGQRHDDETPVGGPSMGGPGGAEKEPGDMEGEGEQ
jgi:excisionase family DNA binding protein